MSLSNSEIRILLADDDQDIRELLEFTLEKEGYEVETAVDGKDAIEKAIVFKPNLVLLDIMMPNMDGVQVCENLRELKEFKNTLIVFLTARTEDYTQISCYEAGGDDFIEKPIKLKVFTSRIKAILKRRHAREDENARLELGPLLIDKERVKVYIDETEVPLVRKEFELLVLLTSYPDKVFSRQEILNRIWDSDVIVGNRTIDVHIRKLREKLGIGNIKTVKGMGYCYETGE